MRSIPTADGRSSPFDFVGRMTAVVAILPVAREAARAMLPAGLGLAEQGVMTSDRHPLVLVLGRQSNVRPRLLPFGFAYQELILAVPFVEPRQGRRRVRGPFCYCPQLFLDRRLPTMGGRLLYGYEKRLAGIRATADSYIVADREGGEPLVAAHFRTAGPAIESSRSGAAELFALPLISQAASGWWYSFADFGLDRALLQPVELRLVIHRAFVSGLPVGEFLFAGVEGDAGRAFRIRTEWRLAGPFARRSPPLPSGAGQSPEEAVT